MEGEEKREQQINRRGCIIFFGIIEVCMAILTIIWPEPRMIVFQAYTILFLLLVIIFRGRKIVKLLNTYIILFIIFVIPAGFMANFYPSRGFYMYSSYVSERKANAYYPEEWSFWPDNYPKDATERRFEHMPGLLQGRGFAAVRFRASDEYIDELVEKYGQDAETNVCLYDERIGMTMYFQVYETSGEPMEAGKKEKLRTTADLAEYAYSEVTLMTERRLLQKEGTIAYIVYDTYDGKGTRDKTSESVFYVNRETNEVGFVNY